MGVGESGSGGGTERKHQGTAAAQAPAHPEHCIPTSSDRKKTRAPAKKKFPTLPLRKSNRSDECRMMLAWKWTRKARMVCL